MTDDSNVTDDAIPTLELPAPIESTLIEQAREATPAECCGILGGTFGPDRRRVTSAYPTTNVARDPTTRYLIDPEEQLAVFEQLEGRGEAIVGFYHSHPRGPSGPSATDREGAAWPDRSYVIVSLEGTARGDDGAGGIRDECVTAWRWRGDSVGFERERIHRVTGVSLER